MTPIAKIWLICKTSIFKIPIMTNITFFQCICFININSFLLKHQSYHILTSIIHTTIHVKILSIIFVALLKIDLTTIFKSWSFSSLFKEKLSSELNLIFQSFSYSLALQLFIVLMELHSMRYLIIVPKLCTFVFVCRSKI